MHFPPYHKSREWRRFFAGVLLGTLAGWLFFLYTHGQLQQKYTEEHIGLTTELHELEVKYEGLLNNKNQDSESAPLTVGEMDVSYTNAKKLEVDLLTQHQLTTMVKDQLSSLPGKPVKVVADQADLILTALENKNYVVDDFTYQLKVNQLIISEVITLRLEIKLVR
ncbi:hypothetical protein JF544_16840 [Halobacillus kuroshimensis]|uniref:Sporulation membrane protein YtrI C-terminal domain-containing protein n=1 Tax=Halobacillus kuroshimensis TaxID=302481 RepID=A0ABS3DZZ4_9BACI|nr:MULTISPECIES: sporulation membrane protein YtrI [Halobacillus]MBN8236928.1 hypothetical protein [Halobacillus kuroshimensis]